MNPSRTRNYKGIGYTAIGYFVLGFCQNGSLVAIGNFGTEFVHKAAKLRTMAAELRKMAPAVRN